MKILLFFLSLTSVFFAASIDFDDLLRKQIDENYITPMTKPEVDSLKSALGQKLFFDKILSGNKDISCATCHHPALRSADELILPIGVGGIGLGSDREIGYGREFIPRNSPEIFNRGAGEWHTMFWDGRVSTLSPGVFKTPVGAKLPKGLDNVLAVQAMFPVFARDEMRGEIGDKDVFGEQNELALISNAMPKSVWLALMDRILAIPEYVELFRQAYPDTHIDKLGFQHAANAIAAFEIDAFTLLDSPWDDYVAGDVSALSEEQKLGASLFYGEANCASCHSGNLMTDQAFHNLGVPQLGPGKGDAEPLDVGRYLESGELAERFAFRTPPLRNVAVTSPYMHNGVYTDLKSTIYHHLYPAECLDGFDDSKIPTDLKQDIHQSDEVKARILASIDPLLAPERELTDEEIDALVAFMHALTERGLENLHHTVPENVPSGLPIDR